jgi:hypothetical protein
MIYKDLENIFWVSQINIQGGLSVDHIGQFAKLWEMLHDVHLDQHTMDSIRWKFTENECYLAKPDYKMQFLGLTTSIMLSLGSPQMQDFLLVDYTK